MLEAEEQTLLRTLDCVVDARATERALTRTMLVVQLQLQVHVLLQHTEEHFDTLITELLRVERAGLGTESARSGTAHETWPTVTREFERLRRDGVRECRERIVAALDARLGADVRASVFVPAAAATASQAAPAPASAASHTALSPGRLPPTGSGLLAATMMRTRLLPPPTRPTKTGPK